MVVAPLSGACCRLNTGSKQATSKWAISAAALSFRQIVQANFWAISTAVQSFERLALCTALIAQLCLVLGKWHSFANFHGHAMVEAGGP